MLSRATIYRSSTKARSTRRAFVPVHFCGFSCAALGLPWIFRACASSSHLHLCKCRKLMPAVDGHAGSSIHTRRARTHGSATAHLQPQRSLRPCRGRARKLRSAAMLDVPASSHFRARQRPAAHKHAHRQHMLQGEGTQAGGWGVGVPDCTFFEPGGPSQRGRVASSAPSARRARPHIHLQAFGRRATCQLGHRTTRAARAAHGGDRAAHGHQGRRGCAG